LCFAVYATANAMSRAYAPLLAPFGLTYVQYLVLLVLWEGDDLPVGALGERLFLNSATLTPLLKRLERAGLIVRRRGTHDERVVRLALTPRGRALESAMRAVPEAFFCKTALSAGSLAKLRAKLGTLHRRLRTSAAG